MTETETDLHSWTVKDLQTELKRRKLYIHGVKKSLVGYFLPLILRNYGLGSCTVSMC